MVEAVTSCSRGGRCALAAGAVLKLARNRKGDKGAKCIIYFPTALQDPIAIDSDSQIALAPRAVRGVIKVRFHSLGAATLTACLAVDRLHRECASKVRNIRRSSSALLTEDAILYGNELDLLFYHKKPEKSKIFGVRHDPRTCP